MPVNVVYNSMYSFADAKGNGTPKSWYLLTMTKTCLLFGSGS